MLAVLAIGGVVVVGMSWLSDGSGPFFSDPRLPARVFRDVENDPAFSLQPDPSHLERSARRSECVDSSGDMPETWRELRSPVPDEAVLDFYEAEAPKHGWARARRWVGGGNVIASGVAFRKEFGRREVELIVYASVDDDLVTVSARIPCGDRPFPIEREP